MGSIDKSRGLVGNPRMCRPVVQKGEYRTTNEEFMNIFLPHFGCQLRDYEVDQKGAIKRAYHIACTSMKIRHRYFVRPIEKLHIPLSQQEQRDMFVDVGLRMSLPVVKTALANASVDSSDINCIIFVSHQPFPFPAFTAHLMSSMAFDRDCSQIPVTSMGCAGGGFALDAARTYLLAHPAHNVLVLCVELCSLGFRTQKKGMSWFLNASLFGDAVAAFVVRGSESFQTLGESPPCLALELVHNKQRLIPGTTEVSYFDYDEWGYNFITTQNLCDVVRENCPEFAKDLAREAFGKHPGELFLNVIHPGGARMIREVGDALKLKGTRSEELALVCMADGGNIASASVIDMIEKSWKQLTNMKEVLCIGMGPGFVMCGVALKAWWV